MKDLIKEIIESNTPKDRILNPRKGKTVFYKVCDDEYVPVRIIEGTFYSNGRVSNFWNWINLKTGEEECGYGNFYKIKKEKKNECVF